MGWPPPLALGSSGALVVELMLVLLRRLHCWDCWPAIPRVSLAESLREDTVPASTAEGTEDTPAAEAFITELEVVRSSAFGRPLVVTEAPPPILMSDTLGEDDFL